jgi:hypothetical protein
MGIYEKVYDFAKSEGIDLPTKAKTTIAHGRVD